MNYEKYFNRLLYKKINKSKDIVVYGQNITLGSALSGLSKKPKTINKKPLFINSTNSENSLVGLGMGMLLSKTNSIFITKQQDFLLLSFDQLVSTTNAFRNRNFKNFFNIISIVVNSGYEGPQSCLNNSNDFYSISGIPTYNLNTKNEIDIFFKYYFNKPGVKLINVAQNLFKKEIIDFKSNFIKYKNRNFIKYVRGRNATLVGFNFSFPTMIDTYNILTSKNIDTTIFSCFIYQDDMFIEDLILDIKKTKRLVIFDDSKSKIKYSDKFIVKLLKNVDNIEIFDLRRENTSIKSSPNADQYVIKRSLLKKLIRKINNE